VHYDLLANRSRSTRCSSVVTFAQPPTSSSLKITDRSVCYALPCNFWNQPPLALRRPHSDTSSFISDSLILSPITSSFSQSTFCSPITLSLFHCRLKTYLFHKSYPRSFTSSCRTAFTDYCPDLFFWDTRFLCLVIPHFFVSGPCARLSWPSHQLFGARKYTVTYRIVS